MVWWPVSGSANVTCARMFSCCVLSGVCYLRAVGVTVSTREGFDPTQRYLIKKRIPQLTEGKTQSWLVSGMAESRGSNDIIIRTWFSPLFILSVSVCLPPYPPIPSGWELFPNGPNVMSKRQFQTLHSLKLQPSVGRPPASRAASPENLSSPLSPAHPIANHRARGSWTC